MTKGGKRKKSLEEDSSDEDIEQFSKKNNRGRKHKKDDEETEELEKPVFQKTFKRLRTRCRCSVEEDIKEEFIFDKFEDLPLELNLHILSFLDSGDLCNMEQSCKKWRDVVENDKKLWKTLCRKRWISCSLKKQDSTWKALYMRYVLLEKRILTSQSPGVTAISIAIEEVYGIRLGAASPCQAHCHSPDRRVHEPIQTISVFSSNEGPIPHWHYVTWGLSELHEKEPNNLADVSGWGFELTFRLAKTEDEQNADAINAPAWPINFLQSLARYVYRTSNVFGKGDHMPLNKPLGGDGSKTALLFTNDTQLKSELKNPFGEFCFIQIVGVTEDELEAAVAWNKKSFLRLMAQQTNNPLLVTDLHRESILSKTEMSRLLKTKTEEEGSTQGLLFVEKMRYIKDKTAKLMALEIPPMVVSDLLKMLKGRIRYKRDFYLVNTVTDSVVNFTPPEDANASDHEVCGWKLDDNQQLTICVSSDLALQLKDRLRQEVGDYNFPALKNFVLRVVELAHWNAKPLLV